MKLSELLQTKSVKEQEMRVEQLIQKANTPLITVQIRIDPLTGAMQIGTLFNDPINADDLIGILAAARDQLIRDVAMARAKSQEQAEAGTEDLAQREP